MNPVPAEARPVLPRLLVVAVTGAALACGVCRFLAWTRHHNAQTCATTDSLCWTWWDWAALPLSITIALTVLTVVYKPLNIGPRLVVVPLTILLAPFPLAAAQTTAGWWGQTAAGGAWACAVALSAWSCYRVWAVTASVGLMVGSLMVLYG
ncbi:hypothetical protein [Streptomyces sp. SDr-06]|uniref:hypothetical protein n=1 Tax=Streptomyces sp. SDr-06 TaxID=2267702 RepID=UPI0011C06FDC|nr:hypothetical protein [Streptomyces sp. SDr-06]